MCIYPFTIQFAEIWSCKVTTDCQGSVKAGAGKGLVQGHFLPREFSGQLIKRQRGGTWGIIGKNVTRFLGVFL